MSEPYVISFSDDSAPTTDNDSVPRDHAPLTCEICGTELVYAGRGRKPRFCAGHKPSRGNASPRAPRGTAKVAQAVATLESGYDVVAAGFMMFGLVNSAATFDAMRAKLAESNVRALEASPTLTAALTRAGTTGGMFAFVLAHLAVAVPVTIVARAEIAERYPKRAKATQHAAQDVMNPGIPNHDFFGA